MNKLALIFAVVSSCMPQPPAIPVEDTEYIDAWNATVLAWEADPSLPTVPDECDGLEIALVTRAELDDYSGPDDKDGYVTTNIVVLVTDVSEDRRWWVAHHEMTHWLAWCTGLEARGLDAADRRHRDDRLWSSTGVVERAVNDELDR